MHLSDKLCNSLLLPLPDGAWPVVYRACAVAARGGGGHFFWKVRGHAEHLFAPYQLGQEIAQLAKMIVGARVGFACGGVGGFQFTRVAQGGGLPVGGFCG